MSITHFLFEDLIFLTELTSYRDHVDSGMKISVPNRKSNSVEKSNVSTETDVVLAIRDSRSTNEISKQDATVPGGGGLGMPNLELTWVIENWDKQANNCPKFILVLFTGWVTYECLRRIIFEDQG